MATITRADGGRAEGHISGGSFDEIWLVDPKGGQHRIPRSQIVDIDHPGAIAGAAGLAFLVLGALSIHADRPDCGVSGAAGCAQAIAPLALGLGMLAWGGSVYGRSVNAARPGPPHGLEPPPAAPAAPPAATTPLPALPQ